MSRPARTANGEKPAHAKRRIDTKAKKRQGRGGENVCEGENETARKVTGGGSHQNANVAWDIYCRVLMQFKTGSLSCSPSPSRCWALINQPLKADVTWIALHTAAVQLHRQCGSRTTAEKFMKMPINEGRPRRGRNVEFVCDATLTNSHFWHWKVIIFRGEK